MYTAHLEEYHGQQTATRWGGDSQLEIFNSSSVHMSGGGQAVRTKAFSPYEDRFESTLSATSWLGRRLLTTALLLKMMNIVGS